MPQDAQRSSGDAFACPDGFGTISVLAISGEEAAAIEGAVAATYEGRIGFDLEGVTLADGVGVITDDRTSLTVYLADHELDRAAIRSAPPSIEPGQLVVTAIATAYRSPDAPAPDLEPLAAGEVILPGDGATDIDSGERAFTVLVDTGGPRHDESIEPIGGFEVLYLDDDEACIDLDFSSLVQGTEATTEDTARRVSGVVRVELLEL